MKSKKLQRPDSIIHIARAIFLIVLEDYRGLAGQLDPDLKVLKGGPVLV